MQRRAATAYVLLFLVLGAGSYGLIATAQQPTVSFQDPDYRLSTGDRFTVDDRQYTVTSVTAEEESGDHGGGTSVTYSGALQWTNDSATYTETWAPGDVVNASGFEGNLTVADESDPDEFTLVEQVDRAAILADDPNADNETITRDGEEYVVVTEGNETTLVPASEYFPAPETRTVAEGETIAYGGNQTTVGNVTRSEVPVSWTAPRTNTVELTNEANVTLDGQQYFVYFASDSEVVLESDYSVYASQTAEISEYTRLQSGLWGVSILSGVAAVLLIGMAFLPSRY
ncbi:MAG: hypothetical protein V5A31_09980 [Haloferacaceae archaeon]